MPEDDFYTQHSLGSIEYSSFCVKEDGIAYKQHHDESAYVNLDYINSEDYKLKFINLTENNILNKQLYKCAVTILTHQSRSQMEDMYLIDYTTGEIKAKQVLSEVPHKVTYNDAMKNAIFESEDYSLVTIHNHPSNNPPTGGDFDGAFNNKYKFGLVICHNGEIYYYKVGEKVFLGYFFDSKVRDYRNLGYFKNEAFEYTLNQYKKDYGIEWRKL